MRNVPLKGFLKKSPMKDIDTKLADKVYARSKVDDTLKKNNLHTEGELRGKKDTTPNQGDNTGSDIQPMNTNMV